METTPKSLRLHIGVFGRTNVGKSSFVNMVSGQDVSITSDVPGTTTDVVEKVMELLPLGPVVLLDTAGLGDSSDLGGKRLERAMRVFERADVACLVLEAGVWGEYEEAVLERSHSAGIPVLAVVNKIDRSPPDGDYLDLLASRTAGCIRVSSVDGEGREAYADEFRRRLALLFPDGALTAPPLLSDLVPAGGIAVLVVPIDLQAPKGRLILPQVQAIRDLLDGDATALVVKEREYAHALSVLRKKPALAVCDSQVVLKMVADTPPDIPCTTFSILFSRCKGDLNECVRGACAIERLAPGDRVLIAESCSHHPMEDDIGRVKIPRWLRQYLGHDIAVDVRSGRDFPADLSLYRLVIHCGGCMTTRREMLCRTARARELGVPITNYGTAISFLQGVLGRVLSPFPAAADIFEQQNSGRGEE